MPAQGGGSMATPLGRLHLVTDCRPGRDPVAVVRAGLSVGVPVVQVRVPDGWTDRAAYELASTIEGLCRTAGAPPPVHHPPPGGLAGRGAHAEGLRALLDAGAAGVGVVSAVSGAADPASACARLLAALPVGDRG